MGKIVSVTCHSIQLEQMDTWIIPVSKGLLPLLLLHHCPHIAWSVAGIFHAGEVGKSGGGQCNKADFTKIPEIPGENEHCTNGVYQALFSAHTRASERDPIAMWRAAKILIPTWLLACSSRMEVIYGNLLVTTPFSEFDSMHTRLCTPRQQSQRSAGGQNLLWIALEHSMMLMCGHAHDTAWVQAEVCW